MLARPGDVNSNKHDSEKPGFKCILKNARGRRGRARRGPGGLRRHAAEPLVAEPRRLALAGRVPFEPQLDIVFSAAFSYL